MPNLKPYMWRYAAHIDEKNAVDITPRYRFPLEARIGPDSPLLVSPQTEYGKRCIRFEHIPAAEYEGRVQQMGDAGTSARLVERINSDDTITLGSSLVEFLSPRRGIKYFLIGRGDYFELYKGDVKKVPVTIPELARKYG